jgi:hypothetical protein
MKEFARLARGRRGRLEWGGEDVGERVRLGSRSRVSSLALSEGSSWRRV